MVWFNGATYEPTNQSSASTLTRPSLHSNSPPPPPLCIPSSASTNVTGLWPARWAIHGCMSPVSKMARSAGGTRVTMALCIASCAAQTEKCMRTEAVCAAAAHFVHWASARRCSLSGPHAPGTALCQGAPHSLLIGSPSHAHPWGAQHGLLCGHSGHSRAQSTSKIKSYIKSVLRVIKKCLQKRGSLNGRQETSTCLGALPTRSDPTSSGSTTRCVTRVSRTYSLPLGIAGL